MRRYIDFRGDDWSDRTDTRMQAARWEACMDGLGSEPPLEGVIDGYPDDLLRELAAEGWLAPYAEPDEPDALRAVLREAMLSTLPEDADTLAEEEYSLIQRVLAEESVYLETVPELEAAYTLRMRLWCDLGVEDGEPCVRLDPQLRELLPKLLLRRGHQSARFRAALFDRTVNSLLNIAGRIDMTAFRDQFAEQVLETAPDAQTDRLAWNHLEATFDAYELDGRLLLVHEGLADPEAVDGLSAFDEVALEDTSALTHLAGWHGLLPEEVRMDEKLQRALDGALRPEWASYEASRDLRLLAKQGAPMQALQEAMASMLMVLPTQHMDSTLREMRQTMPRWTGDQRPPEQAPRVLH